jgi:hypothetical protein
MGKATACNSPWPSRREDPVNRRLARYEIVPGCMGDDTSSIACSGLPLSCDSPLQLYVLNRRGKMHIAPAGSTSNCGGGLMGKRLVRCAAKAIVAGKSAHPQAIGGIDPGHRDDQKAGEFADSPPGLFVLLGEMFQPQ